LPSATALRAARNRISLRKVPGSLTGGGSDGVAAPAGARGGSRAVQAHRQPENQKIVTAASMTAGTVLARIDPSPV
jgi:hypothetical protein